MRGLVCENLRKIFQLGTQEAGVKNVSCHIEPGEGFSLLGPSGCGKTTSLRIIGGLEKPDSGDVIHDGKKITNLAPQHRDIRTVFQKYALFQHLSVLENIAFGLRMQKRSENEIQAKTKQMVDLLEIGHLLQRPIGKLSGGEQQRVALARAIVTEPSVLLLDEPLSALDLKLRERMQFELLSLRKKLGLTFVFVTHDQNEAMVLSDRIAVMHQGLIQQIGAPREIYERPKNKFVATFIGQANFFGEEFRSQILGNTSNLAMLSGDAQWMVRPENMSLSIPGDSSVSTEYGLLGKLHEVLFLGDHWLAKVMISEKQFLVKLKNPPPSLLGEDVLVRWKDLWTVAAS